MFVRVAAGNRLLGFDAGDWILLVGGWVVGGLLTFLA
jgi:hypothetical protein